MTGKSLPWKMTPEERSEFMKYCKKPISAFMITGGTGLLLEHLFTFNGFDLLDFWGHEFLGFGMIVVGILISTKWSQWEELKLWKIKNWLR